MYNLLGPMYLHDILCKEQPEVITAYMEHVYLWLKLCSLLWRKNMERA